MRHCSCLSVIVYVSETVIWNEKEEYKIRPVQMDTFRYLLGIKKIDKVPNTWIRKVCSDEKGGQ